MQFWAAVVMLSVLNVAIPDEFVLIGPPPLTPAQLLVMLTGVAGNPDGGAALSSCSLTCMKLPAGLLNEVSVMTTP